MGHEDLKLLDDHRPKLHWDPRAAAHCFDWLGTKSHTVFYPTLLSLAVSVREAEAWGFGVSIWELGQGLDYWFDLLVDLVFLQILDGTCGEISSF